MNNFNDPFGKNDPFKLNEDPFNLNKNKDLLTNRNYNSPSTFSNNLTSNQVVQINTNDYSTTITTKISSNLSNSSTYSITGKLLNEKKFDPFSSN